MLRMLDVAINCIHSHSQLLAKKDKLITGMLCYEYISIINYLMVVIYSSDISKLCIEYHYEYAHY